MPNSARQLRAAAASEQGRPSSSSFRSLNEDDHGDDGDDDLHLSSHEISDHHPEGYAAAEDGHPSPSDANIDDAYENYRFAIAPSPDQPDQKQHEKKQSRGRQNRHQKQHPPEQELTRIPLTRLNPADRILDRTFGDSLRSLSEGLSNLGDADAASDEEELALRILEETARAGRRAYGEDWDRDDGDDGDDGGDDGGYDDAYNYGGPVGRCRHGHTSKDPLGLLSEDDDDGTSETDAWERACSAHSISSAGGRHQCADACRIYDCCAADADADAGAGAGEESSSCADQKKSDCERFWKLCPMVLDMPTEPTSTQSPQRTSNWEQQQLLQACGEANTDTAKFNQCQDLCADHLCCLDMYGGGCIKLKEYQCHLYQEPCSILAVDLAQAIAKHVGEEHEEKVEGGEGRYLR